MNRTTRILSKPWPAREATPAVTVNPPLYKGSTVLFNSYADMVKAGIIDPVKVTRTALQNAASIAALVLTTESAVVEKPEESEPAAAGGHGHMH